MTSNNFIKIVTTNHINILLNIIQMYGHLFNSLNSITKYLCQSKFNF